MGTSKPTVAKRIYIAPRPRGAFQIDGQDVAYHIADDPSVEKVAPDLYRVNVAFYAEAVDLRPRTRAGLEARAIVRQGLRDVLEWIGEAE